MLEGVAISFSRESILNVQINFVLGFPRSLVSKESACSAGDSGSVLGSGRSPGEGNAYPLRYSCLENSMVRAAWQATVYEIAKSQTN